MRLLMGKTATLLMILLLVLACVVRAQARAAGTSETTVCKLKTVDVHTRRVHLTAVAIQDPRHGATLIDPACKGQRIGFRFADALASGSKASHFSEALDGHPMYRNLRIFTVTLAGTFDPSAVGNPHGLLTVDQVDKFKKQSTFPNRIKSMDRR